MTLMTGQNLGIFQPANGVANSTFRQASTLSNLGNGRPANTFIVGVISKGDQHGLLRGAHTLQRPALGHDDCAHTVTFKQ